MCSFDLIFWQRGLSHPLSLSNFLSDSLVLSLSLSFPLFVFLPLSLSLSLSDTVVLCLSLSLSRSLFVSLFSLEIYAALSLLTNALKDVRPSETELAPHSPCYSVVTGGTCGLWLVVTVVWTLQLWGVE